ncbi:hypothetical protein V6M85_01245 [Sulfolobus tengchongensis]|uniref:Nucleotidyltransferase n=1 Tax=Sulfolobus tengchongensis TaxID=207809 RepID=A0AAX4L1W4_9CREN
MSQFIEICKRTKVLAYFGSYVRQDDFVDNVSDINIFAITNDKSILLELASLGYSPIVLSESNFIDLCEKGDPLCYYLLYDSNVICGEFPRNVKFNLNNFTCERIRRSIFAFLSLAVSAFFRQDEISALSNSFRALRNVIQWKSCTNLNKIPIRINDLKDKCEELKLSICNEFSDIILVRRMKEALSLWSLDKVAEAICREFNMECVKPSKILQSVKNPLQVTYNQDGTVIVKDSSGNEAKLS